MLGSMSDRSNSSSRRERLLEVGRDAFGRQPYDDVSLSDIAKTAGVAHGLPFHYFSNKRGFYVEVVRSIADEMRIVHSQIGDFPPAAAVRDALHRHIDYFSARPHTLLDPMRSGLVADPRVREVFDEARWDGALSVLRMLGIDDPAPAVQLVIRAWQAFHDDLLSRWLVDPTFTRERIVELLFTSLVSVLESATGPFPRSVRETADQHRQATLVISRRTLVAHEGEEPEQPAPDGFGERFQVVVSCERPHGCGSYPSSRHPFTTKRWKTTSADWRKPISCETMTRSKGATIPVSSWLPVAYRVCVRHQIWIAEHGHIKDSRSGSSPAAPQPAYPTLSAGGDQQGT
jgi:AcrR family transcriptional regulator